MALELISHKLVSVVILLIFYSLPLSTGKFEGRQGSKEPICPNDIGPVGKRPILCYQCESEARDKNPVCDSVLWQFARRTEKHSLRVRCPSERGSFCVKKIEEMSGIRRTERGCFGPGPILTKDGVKVPLGPGCASYTQNGFKTTTCLCNRDLCNSSHNTLFISFYSFSINSLILLIRNFS